MRNIYISLGALLPAPELGIEKQISSVTLIQLKGQLSSKIVWCFSQTHSGHLQKLIFI